MSSGADRRYRTPMTTQNGKNDIETTQDYRDTRVQARTSLETDSRREQIPFNYNGSFGQNGMTCNDLVKRSQRKSTLEMNQEDGVESRIEITQEDRQYLTKNIQIALEQKENNLRGFGDYVDSIRDQIAKLLDSFVCRIISACGDIKINLDTFLDEEFKKYYSDYEDLEEDVQNFLIKAKKMILSHNNERQKRYSPLDQDFGQNFKRKTKSLNNAKDFENLSEALRSLESEFEIDENARRVNLLSCPESQLVDFVRLEHIQKTFDQWNEEMDQKIEGFIRRGTMVNELPKNLRRKGANDLNLIPESEEGQKYIKKEKSQDEKEIIEAEDKTQEFSQNQMHPHQNFKNHDHSGLANDPLERIPELESNTHSQDQIDSNKKYNRIKESLEKDENENLKKNFMRDSCEENYFQQNIEKEIVEDQDQSLEEDRNLNKNREADQDQDRDLNQEKDDINKQTNYSGYQPKNLKQNLNKKSSNKKPENYPETQINVLNKNTANPKIPQQQNVIPESEGIQILAPNNQNYQRMASPQYIPLQIISLPQMPVPNQNYYEKKEIIELKRSSQMGGSSRGTYVKVSRSPSGNRRNYYSNKIQSQRMVTSHQYSSPNSRSQNGQRCMSRTVVITSPTRSSPQTNNQVNNQGYPIGYNYHNPVKSPQPRMKAQYPKFDTPESLNQQTELAQSEILDEDDLKLKDSELKEKIQKKRESKRQISNEASAGENKKKKLPPKPNVRRPRSPRSFPQGSHLKFKNLSNSNSKYNQGSETSSPLIKIVN